MTGMFVLSSVSLAVGATALLISEIFGGHARRVDRRINQLRRDGAGDSAQNSKLFRDLQFVESGKHRLLLEARQFLEQSAVPITLAQLVAICGLCGGAFCLPLTLLRARGTVMFIAFLAGVVAPVIYVAFKRQRRIRQLQKLLPEAFDVMVRAVQAGQSVSAALQLVGTEGRQPLAREFAKACEQHNLGLSFEQTLQELCRRVPVMELRILAIALIVQRQTGGNPLEIISNMASLIRKRASFQAKMRALTGEGRMQAIVLSALPIVTFIGLYVARRDYLQALLDRPRILQALVAAQVVAALWIRRIVRIPF
ncbi:Bacterial type II secretion system protein F domain protein [Caulifigura coniformis]|uniref:Bacterial type II secretion system protein F domain protein n=1 Tax=Caulifigura coniformis TaxID=2527983 RepID=A0A517SMV5_9PLAN|nr:type II secretion system F family protein [Caulifigura coniformis]QDT57459.1 Bacterial type II secretion system protein F domain protein [Caulifigura coniformis]